MFIFVQNFAEVAQLVEHNLAKNCQRQQESAKNHFIIKELILK